MNDNDRVKYTTYLAGAIESASSKEMKGWRDEIKEKIKNNDLLIYDPISQEAIKTGKPTGEHINYTIGLKKAGRYDLFFDEMWKIWFGAISKNTDLIQLLIALRMRKHIDGNRPRDLAYWGDTEAVIRSDFIIVYYPIGLKTVGTIFEVVFAFLFRIPIYLIVPNASRTDTNSSLLFGNQISNNGQVLAFSTINECVKSIKETYKI